MSNNVPDDFAWVAARHEWSAIGLLNELKRQAEENTNARNEQLPPGRADFRFYDYEGDGFSVGLNAPGNPPIVDFAINDGAVTVARRDQNVGVTRIAAVLSTEGECVCRIGDEELRPWQVLRRVLEPLFFG